MDAKRAEQVRQDHADLLAEYDGLARQIYNHLDSLHVDLCQLAEVTRKIYELKPEEIRVLESSVAVQIPEPPTIYHHIQLVRNWINVKNKPSRLVKAGYVLQDWIGERIGEKPIVRNQETERP